MKKAEILEILEFEGKRYAAMAKLADGQKKKELNRRASAFYEAGNLIKTLEKVTSVQTFQISYPKSAKEKRKWTSQYGTNAYYSGKHWAVRKRDSEFWHWLVRAATSNVDPVKEPVEIYFSWDDGIDVDNHSIMGKMITDALKGRVIPDDNRRYLKAVRHGFNDDDIIRVQIRELGGKAKKETGKEGKEKGGKIKGNIRKTAASDNESTKSKAGRQKRKEAESGENTGDDGGC